VRERDSKQTDNDQYEFEGGRTVRGMIRKIGNELQRMSHVLDIKTPRVSGTEPADERLSMCSLQS